MNPVAAASEVVGSIANFFNPQRRHEAFMRSAIGAAENYIKVNEREDEFSKVTDAKQKQYLAHFKKQFNAWKNR